MATNPVEDEFQEEVLRLFALEALEWIRQVKAALLELEGAPAQERIQTLYDVILRSLTNLKGSAATVELPCIENLTFTLVPLLQRMQGKKMSTTSPQYAALRQGLEALSSAIQMLSIAETKTAVMAELESISRRQAEAVQADPAAAHGRIGESTVRSRPVDRGSAPSGFHADETAEPRADRGHGGFDHRRHARVQIAARVAAQWQRR